VLVVGEEEMSAARVYGTGMQEEEAESIISPPLVASTRLVEEGAERL